ncbi:protein of unknown function - conserved [Leishmania donovani]|uniref:Hypothetical_protein n=2 Tax=Leishmania donovani species complex TaxID=38574 RepID=A0A6L0XEF0_LEIIN|nr:hypothetical protein CGC20_17715 [Leishmania donovani]CAC9490353.1 hypothetical_protein [Leishmania infantum]CAJ1989062.1 protein of unknown function - conserved [Leishmania donovani]SUZ42066.1 hypothetical_protein [Leishmania infantum]VDZ44934.1 hypothetical_protein [Leishmania donovani]
MRRNTFLADVAPAVLLVCFLCGVVLNTAAHIEGPRMSPVLQCSEDFSLVCAGSTSTRNLWGCMMKNADKISNELCREYVIGFYACTRDAEKRGSCVYPAADYATSVRRCLRTIPEDRISEECRSSRFYSPIAELIAAKRGY